MWKKLSSKIVFSHPWMEVIEDKVQLPNGDLTTYLTTTPGRRGITVIALDSQNNVLLQDEYSYPIGHRMLEFPGGGIGKEESVEAAVKRELLEETGYECNDIEVLGWYYTSNRRCDMKMYVAIARNLTWVGTKHEAEESPVPQWHSIQQLEQLLTEQKIYNGTVLAAWAMARSSCAGAVFD
ncbi:MAG: NUDIX hydrolase [Oligoflexales bacterium]